MNPVSTDHSTPPHVLILGGGFGGLTAARRLAGSKARITLVDRRNHHLFQPLLYQVATASLAAPSIAAPLRHILRGQRNLTVLLEEVSGVDLAARQVRCGSITLDYDHLVVATGATHAYFGHDEWAPFAPGAEEAGRRPSDPPARPARFRAGRSARTIPPAARHGSISSWSAAAPPGSNWPAP